MHFHVIIALHTIETDLMAQLTERLTPFDENKQVNPWRDYATGDPADHWFVRSMRRSADHLRNGTGLKTHVPGYRGQSSHSSAKTHGQQRAEFAKDADIARRLDTDLTWENIVHAYSQRFPADEPLCFDAQTGRAYEIKNTNPDAKWDYWSLRKDGDHFIRKGGGRTDIGFLADLDIDAMRRNAASDVPTSQFITIDGEWIERPRAYGSTPAEINAYNVRVNEYIDRMQPTNALALVTYHT